MTLLGGLLKAVPLWLWLTLAACGVIGYQHLRLESVKADRDEKAGELVTANNRIESIQNTARLQRELNAESQQTIVQFEQAKANANKKSSALAADLRSGRSRLQVNGQCVSSGRTTGTDRSKSDGNAFRLAPDAESAYLRLTSGIDLQRAQVIALQQRVRSLESRCKIGG